MEIHHFLPDLYLATMQIPNKNCALDIVNPMEYKWSK